MVMASNKIFYLLFISCNVFCGLYPFYPSEAASAPPTNTTASQGQGGLSSGTIVAIVLPISVAVLIFIVCTCCFNKRTRNKYGSDPEGISAIDISNLDSLQYDFLTIEAATNNFSADDKICGGGGFGEVYKGMLPNGQEIAVKRLVQTISYPQGIEELKNEVEVHAQLQHRNLVRLLGFCVNEEEKIIIYEYVPNKCLGHILFDLEKQGQLDWTKRYKIVKGIARGIQYLHEDSRLRIVHRDIKPWNILLDNDMNPKITNFGLATIFKIDQTQGHSGPIIGTCGYMSHEYQLQGKPSLKSDVYSFGILLLEIINGKRRVDETEDDEPMLSRVWRLWEDGEALEFLDPTIRESYSYNPNEVMRCIHIALLCVQEDPADRPSMSSIILMLESYSLTLPSPSDPTGFCQKSKEGEEDELSTSRMEDLYSDISESNGGGSPWDGDNHLEPSKSTTSKDPHGLSLNNCMPCLRTATF